VPQNSPLQNSISLLICWYLVAFLFSFLSQFIPFYPVSLNILYFVPQDNISEANKNTEENKDAINAAMTNSLSKINKKIADSERKTQEEEGQLASRRRNEKCIFGTEGERRRGEISG
jgi:hypothetical protein